ncbi:MAG: thiamine-phosphate kinase [Terriglobia bacterium]
MISQIDRLTQKKKPRHDRLLLSIGDDAAAFLPNPGYVLLVSSDALIEGIHFERKWTSARTLGWKSLAVNLSDIAAMGGVPLYVTTTLGLPASITPRFITDFYRGLSELASQFGVTVVGGDTCSSLRDLFIDITVIGQVRPREMLTRSKSKPGDLIFVTGRLGESAIGLDLLRTQSKISLESRYVERHLRPMPRLAVARHIASHRLATSMIDLSDGLSTDLNHICQQSRVGAIIEASSIPLPQLRSRVREWLPKSPLHYALNGGEDYELLFTVSPAKRHLVPATIEGIEVSQIGIVTRRKELFLTQGKQRTRRLSAAGFDHFNSSSLSPH